jgi:hypothetical protein
VKFVHYSKEPIKELESRVYDNSEEESSKRLNYHKPIGLWFSIENTDNSNNIGWKEWCEEGEFALDRLRCSHEIKFKENAKILYLKCEKEILDFWRKYWYIPNRLKEFCEYKTNFHYPDIIRISENLKIPIEECKRLSEGVSYPAWSVISKEYDGIIISPYQWNLQFHTCFFWYHGWDCASGCVWNLDSIKEFNHLE